MKINTNDIDNITSFDTTNIIDDAMLEKISSVIVKKITMERVKEQAIFLQKNGYFVTPANRQTRSMLKIGPIIDMRYPSLAVLAHTIQQNKIGGSIAELGVYKGNFAKHIRACFPERKFYLFDTFEGFNDKQAQSDMQKFSAKIGDFSNTSVEGVLKNIGATDLCIVKKGFFPETTKGVNDIFAFVSLDVDLYQPTRDGLNFFYKHLHPGGYIMVHDFGSLNYQGCTQAVLEFCTENKIGFVPIADNRISAVITKWPATK